MPALGGLFSFKIPPPGGISYYIKIPPVFRWLIILVLFL